ncbi:MAG: hypothetical protein Q4D27_03230 [Coriobacteriia bacterium]|nr:hypothetical protein [Coriobacteriia bacterium]
MPIDPILCAIVIVVLVAALGVGWMLFNDRSNRRDMHATAESRREERAHLERLEQERMERLSEILKEESQAMEQARMRMAYVQEDMSKTKQAFRQRHDQLIDGILMQAKAGCDGIFRQRFGITRPPKAENPMDDPEVQDYLHEHYAELRDTVLAETIRDLMDAEVDRRIAALREEADADELLEEAGEAEAVPEAETDAATDAETPVETEPEPTVDADAADAAEPEHPAEAEGGESAKPIEEDEVPEEAPESSDAETDEDDGDADASDEPEPTAEDDEAPEESIEEDGAEGDEEPEEEFDRTPIEEAVREEFDLDSVRTYLLAAISARYDENGRPIGDLPWPAFTSISPRGYGELVLAEGAPVYAQDSYREFAWRKFHTGRRAEKPARGEYSWPESHELGDAPIEGGIPTPAGVFSAEGPNGQLVLHELFDCSWMRHNLEYKGAFLEPDTQRSFLLNLEGLRKGDELRFLFDGPDFLEEAENGPFFLNALGEVNEAHVGISVSNPEVANVGEAPYELAERTPTGFVFRMTHDARRHYDDTYPQFLEIHLAWCQPPSPRPDRIIRHVVN